MKLVIEVYIMIYFAMTSDKTPLQPKPTTRERVLDAAERLLVHGGAAFSMRELADAAGVSFATPFNQFGSKASIMLALSARRIAVMHKRIAETALPETAVARVLMTVDVAAAVMLEAPVASRAVMGAISSPSEASGDVASHSSALWAKSIGAGEGLAAATRPLAMATLPDQLAVAFRGVLSFWSAGEISDQAFRPRARAAAAAVLLGFVGRDQRSELLASLGS